MARRKVLRSVVNSTAQSFSSLMNYRDDDYVLGHILTAARRRPPGVQILTADLLTGNAEPADLAPPPVAQSIASYARRLPDTVVRSGSDMAFVRAATLRVTFDTGVERAHQRFSHLIESPFVCEVSILDDQGRQFTGRVSDWWFPEKERPLPWLARVARFFLKWKRPGRTV